jgi:hypothetical protein
MRCLKESLFKWFTTALATIFLLNLFACSPSTGEDYHQEGQAILRDLTLVFRKTQNKEELLQNKEVIKGLYIDLVELLIAAREEQRYASFHSTPQRSIIKDVKWTKELQAELFRLYSLEGVRESLEKLQAEALRKLDAYEQYRTISLH